MSARRIDHVVVAVRDLEAAGSFYGRLGFQVGARNRHPWGTENRLVQFRTSFIELITVSAEATAIPEHEARRFSFGAFVRDYLREREGLAMLVLDSDDATADGARFASCGIGDFEPFFFDRKGRRPDGSQTHVAFSLAFAVEPHSPRAGFFVCQQHTPESFWNPAHQQHDNGADNIVAIGMTASDPASCETFLSQFSFSPVRRVQDGELLIGLQNGRLEVRQETAGWPGLRLGSMSIRIHDLVAQGDRLAAAGIPFTWQASHLTIPPEVAYGLEIRFEDAAQPAGDISP